MHKNTHTILSDQKKHLNSFPLKGIVWKLLVNLENNMLLVEQRIEESRQVSFVGIDLIKMKILWEQNKLPERWWLSLFETKYDKVLLHGYKDHQNPTHQKMYILDVNNGNLLWKNEELKPIKLLAGKVIAEAAETKLVLDAESGKKQGEVSNEIYRTILSQEESNHTALLNYGMHYSSENSYFSKLSTFVRTITNLVPEKSIEYIEHKQKIIVSFYTSVGEKLTNYILVTDEEGVILLKDTVAQELSAVAEHCFFLYNDHLIFIKNRKELVIFEL